MEAEALFWNKFGFLFGQKGLCCADIIGKKIKRDRLIKQGFHDLKLRHCIDD